MDDDHVVLPSFPTRRSSDLGGAHPLGELFARKAHSLEVPQGPCTTKRVLPGGAFWPVAPQRVVPRLCRGSQARVVHEGRSEEHTSELQSHVNLVCRLLLEKK